MTKCKPGRFAVRSGRWLAFAGLALFLTGGAGAQVGRPGAFRVTPSATIDHPILVLPNDAGATVARGWRLSVDIEDGFRVYRASRSGPAQFLRVALSAPQRRVAFNPASGRFEILTQNVRVELADFGQLDTVVAAAGGTGGKVYPLLGFALVHLPADADPVAAAQTIANLPGVRSARLMVRGPKRETR